MSRQRRRGGGCAALEADLERDHDPLAVPAFGPPDLLQLGLHPSTREVPTDDSAFVDLHPARRLDLLHPILVLPPAADDDLARRGLAAAVRLGDPKRNRPWLELELARGNLGGLGIGGCEKEDRR